MTSEDTSPQLGSESHYNSEQEYLRHAVARIAALKPDLVLVHRNVSRIAQESLNALGITLVLNVKLSVLERISRCTNADIVTSIDAHVGKPQLGTCRTFYTESFVLKNGEVKTLMFFEGCAFPQLGCTILLRGSSEYELSKLKKVVSLTILMIYNSKLEKSLLLDEFAKPPEAPVITFLTDGNSPEIEIKDTPLQKPNNIIQDTFVRGISSDKKPVEEKRVTSKMIVDGDGDDPLHVNSKETDTSPVEEDKTDLSFAEVPVTKNKFRKALDDTILSISPLIMFDAPYLETEVGRNCELRKYFPDDIYVSAQLGNMKNSARSTSAETCKPCYDHNALQKKEMHPFVTAKLKDSSDSEDVQTLLASFRANGGRYLLSSKNTSIELPPKRKPQPKMDTDSMIDALDPKNHQRLHVLFCSFSQSSSNSPGFCVNPWVVSMDFYGYNDIPLGSFLTKYCFRESYICPSGSCDTPMIDHERRFVHGNSCIHVSLHEINTTDKSVQPILMWSYCTICKLPTPVIAMSNDMWGLSFAKYLELRFHGIKYTCRAVRCEHSLHHDFCQYFYHKNIIASFRYSAITLWEISLPAHILKVESIDIEMPCVLEQIKKWSLMGHEIFNSILEKLYSLENDNNLSAVTFQGITSHLTKQQTIFKQQVEEIQVVLSSPLFTDDNTANIPQIDIWKLEDSIVLLKKSVAEILLNWNALLHKLDTRKKDDKQKSRTSVSEVADSANVREEQHKSKGSFTEINEVVSPITPPDSCFEECSVEDTDKLWRDFSQIRFLDETAITPDEALSGKNKMQKHPEEIDTDKLSSSDKICNAFTTPVSSNIEDNTDLIRDMKNQISLNLTSIPEKTSTSQLQSPSVTGDVVSTPSQFSDKITVKTILSQLLINPFQSNVTILPNPISSQEHYLLSVSCSIPIVVYENEPSSIIAYALSTYHYQYSLENLQKLSCSTSDPSATTRSGFNGNVKRESLEYGTNDVTKESVSISESDDIFKNDTAEDSKARLGKSQDTSHIEVSFSDATANFTVKVYFAEQFANLRALVFPDGEEKYIRTLSRCIQWAAHGGKSGSAFCKTKDDRFILKQMSRLEIQPFLDFAPRYFNFIRTCYSSCLPTLLGKIVGVYRVKCRTAGSSITSQSNLLVMENLFYRRNIVRKFDLKGSVRNRLVDTEITHEGELVLLDENLINMTCESPLYIHPHSKTVLIQAINNDVTFLSSQSVMDYSLLVGLDETKQELVVGIIDYIRTFTWDKKLETMVKKSGILGGQGKLPTIVSPEEYKNRFIAAMHKYFLAVPDQWFFFGRGFSY